MSATEVLRRMLDERGVEWTEGIARPELTQVRIDGKVVKFHSWQPNTLKVSLFNITPAQAIAATLGSCNCSNSERTEPRLPYFWTHDGTLHIELPKLPESISVRLPDQRDREVGSARVWQFTRDSGTCKIHDCEGSFSAVNRPVWRCDCGAFMTQYTDATTYHKPRFCPNCGRRVVEVNA